MAKRVFLIVLDSVGVGYLPDAADFGDVGADTVGTCVRSGKLSIPNLRKLGLFNIDGVNYGEHEAAPTGCFGKLREASRGKDTTIGHWEISGVISPKALPTYPNGFPKEIIEEYKRLTGHGVLCNLPYSGTDVLTDYGRQQVETGDLIVYTSADSVFQVAAHEGTTGLDELYRCCQIARDMLQGEHGVGRIIARPFEGEFPNFKRTANRRDFSLPPPKPTMLDYITKAGLASKGVGKIYDIFAGQGVEKKLKTHDNDEGMDMTIELANSDFEGLCFVNLVDFDMQYGHRNDVAGYTAALNRFDERLGELLPLMRPEDLLIITADHGCDPGHPGTDHSREHIPLLVYGQPVRSGMNLGIGDTYAHIAATVLDYLGVEGKTDGQSLLPSIQK